MKYMIYLLAALYIIGGYYFINVFFLDDNKIDIEKIKESIVIIIPQNKLISYKNNPKGLFEEYKDSGIGAGFFIDNKGTIQTVSHILLKNNIVLYNGKEYLSEIIKDDTINDLAILQINTVNKLALAPGNINNNNIITFGINPKNLKIIYNTGTIINQKSKLEDKSNLLEISNNLKPGFSGGPIINSNGKVIGINYAISDGKNYGIKLPFQIH